MYAFIDSQNLNLGVRDQGWKYAALKKFGYQFIVKIQEKSRLFESS